MAAAAEGLLKKSHHLEILIVNTELGKAYVNTAFSTKLTSQESSRRKRFDVIFK